MTLELPHFGHTEYTWINCPCVTKSGPNMHGWQNIVSQSLHLLNDGRSFLQMSHIFLSVICCLLFLVANNHYTGAVDSSDL